jgi:hypothetical protein
MKYIPCLLALALFAISLQACGSKSAQGDANVQPAALNQSSPQPDSQQSGGPAVSAPSEFKEVFTGTIDDRHAVRMSLERNGADLTGDYFYERAGAFNSVMRALDLKGRIDQDGNVTLTETTYKNDKEEKTGEFKGKLDGLSANGDVRLRFSGMWAGDNGKQMPFKLQQLRFDLGGLKIDRREEKKKDKTLGYEIETATPRLAGADSGRVDNFNQAVGKLVAEAKGVFEETAKADAHDSASAVQNYNLGVSYEIMDADKDFISLLFSFNSYLGGAHPNTNTKSFNYDLNRDSPVKLADLFTPGSNYLNVISGYSIGELKKIETTSQVESGAGPKIENFHSWNITPFGLQITFDAYQVGPYAVGPHEVVIPYSVLKPIIRPDGLLAQFAK